MWWSDGQLARAERDRTLRRARFVCLLVVAASISGCSDGGGFRPMYGKTPSGVGLEEKLATIDVAPIPSRVGQRIRNELIFANTGGGDPAPPAYRLEIAIRESIGSTLVKTTGEAVSQIYNLDATFKLISLKDKKVLLTGTSYSRAAFERFQSIYSNVRARDDAENRAARTVADDLKGRLAAFLSGPRA